MDRLRQDLRVSLRALINQPGFTSIAIVVLALGIGANTAIFTLVEAVMLRPLPVERPHELYRLGDGGNCCVVSGFQGRYSIFAYPLYELFRSQLPEFVDLAAFEARTTLFSVRRAGSPGAALPLSGELVSGNYFETFGVRPAIGRLLAATDDRAGAPFVAVMSYRAWQERYHLDPAVIGSAFTINGLPATVVGVTTPAFFGDTLRPDAPDVWLPLAIEPILRQKNSLLASATQNWLYVVGRLNPTAQVSQVQARATLLLQQWLTDRGEVPERFRDRIPQQTITIASASGGVGLMQRRYADGLRALALVSGLVLLIACANIANLLLARANHGQLAVRAALGASPSRLVRQTVTEGVLLGVAGGAAGIGVAYLLTRVILTLAFHGAPAVPVDPHPSLPVLAFALMLSLLTGVVFSAGPAWITSRANPIEALRGAGRSTAGRSAAARQVLVVLQAALSVVLLVSAGLVTESLRRLEHQSFGFESAGRFVASINPVLAGYRPEQLPALYRQLEDRLGGIAGITSVSLSLYSPMRGDNWSSGISIEGRSSDPSREDSASWNRVGPRYFETLGTRLVRGRSIGEQDTPASPRVTVVNQAFVRKFFPDSDPLGKHLGIGDASHSNDFEIVGVVEDTKYVRANEPAWPTFFLPLLQTVAQRDASDGSAQTRSTYVRDIELRMSGRSDHLEASVRQALAEIDPDLTLLGLVTLDEQLGRNFNQQRLMARLTMLYAILALILACVGLYGVAAYTVTRRTGEIGIRMALGADRGRVIRWVLAGTLRQIACGLLIGIPLALATGRALSSQLYDVSPRDPVILNAAALALVVSAGLAALIPARRAASIEPVRALRAD